MKCLLQVDAARYLLFVAILICASSQAQSHPQLVASSDNPATLRSVRALPENDGPAVEIISSRPLAPAISKIDNPSRLVIDLPNAVLSGPRKTLDFHSREVNDIRISQFRQAPPVARIVVDLARPITYTWDAAGNRLMVRMRSSVETAQPASVPAFTPGVKPVAVPVTTSPAGAVVLAGSRIAAGSSVTAGSDTAVLRLGRGGEVRVCPQTTVSVSASQNGRSLMLGMSTGAMETHYSLDASSDSVFTPDFRILLVGPGEFHYGISANSHGDTCIQALPGNTASVLVSELLGNGTYQVKPTEQVVFHSGELSKVDTVIPAGCGCPTAAPAVMRASSAPAISEGTLGSNVPLAGPETAPLPPSKSNDLHVQVEAPFVFRANELPPASTARQADLPPAQPAPTQEAEALPFRTLPRLAWLQAVALPPRLRTTHHGFFGKIRGFFAAIFS